MASQYNVATMSLNLVDALYGVAVEYAAAMMGVTTAPNQRLASTWGARLVPGTVPPEALDRPDSTVVRCPSPFAR